MNDLLSKIATIIALSILLQFLYTSSTEAQNSKPEFVQSIEQDLFNSEGGQTFNNSLIKRIDASKYANLELKWYGKIGDNACMVYHGSYASTKAKDSKSNVDNIAIKLLQKGGSWRVYALNIAPSDQEGFYDYWLKIQGCKDN